MDFRVRKKMGGRGKGAEVEERAHKSKPESTELSSESQPVTNPSLDGVELQSENRNPSSVRVKSNSKIRANSAKLFSSSKKRERSVVVRRSERLRNVIHTAPNQNMELITTEIIISDGEKECELPCIHEEKQSPQPTLDDKRLEEKINYLVQLLEAQGNAIEALKSKIEALTDKNRQLAMKLEIAQSKLEAYENGTHAFSEVLEKLKDMIIVSNLTKASETAVNISSQAILNGFPSLNAVHEPTMSPAKRKRVAKEGTNKTT